MKKQILVALAAMALSSLASAQTYGVVSFGGSKVAIDCEGAEKCDESGTSFKLLGGYKFSPNVALEGGYMSFGKAKFADAGDTGSVSVGGFGIGGAFHQELSPNWMFVARAGLGFMTTKLAANVAGVGSGSTSDNNVAVYGGLGLGYKINKQMSIDASWDFSKGKYNKDGFDLGSANVNAYSIGMTFAF
jgi:OmpA-OmpF porin, OOP family